MDGRSSDELFREFDSEKRLVSALRADLNSLSDKLHEYFQKKRGTGQEIAQRLRQVKKLREERDTLTLQVKKYKEERKTSYDLLQAKISEVKKLREQRDEIKKKYAIHGNPRLLQSEIEKLEFRIETEGMGFDAEQKIMKRMRDLKKRVVEGQEVSGVLKSIISTENTIQETRRAGDGAHRAVQRTADESQKKHEELIALLKEVDELRSKEDEIENEIANVKKNYEEVKQKLGDDLLKLNDVSKKVHEFVGEGRKRKEEQRAQELQNMTKSVEEKLRSGGKLTRADLLAWQAKEGKE